MKPLTQPHREASELPRAPARLYWAERFQRVRAQTERICAPLITEDYGVQSSPEVSPPKWHLAHTTWFFETFIAREAGGDAYPLFHPGFHYLFNSYYKGLGPHLERGKRGLMSRPSVQEVYAYRKHVDDWILGWLEIATPDEIERASFVLDLGLHHEQQHQELLVTDIKHIFATNHLSPAFPARPAPAVSADPRRGEPGWLEFKAGLYPIGATGDGFSFDNENPRHSVYLEDFAIAARPVTVAEYLEFVEAGGYRDPRHWLSDGWDWLCRSGCEAPLYWRSDRRIQTLAGPRPLRPDEPVCHLSYYEADAYARWRGARLPLESEWEVAARSWLVSEPRGLDLACFLESERFHPVPVSGSATFFGNVWEWTASPYQPYPGYRAFHGAFAEYNGKFMCNQLVLRGGSCATPRSHFRPSYRNFFPPETRWQFSGVRLARAEN